MISEIIDNIVAFLDKDFVKIYALTVISIFLSILYERKKSLSEQKKEELKQKELFRGGEWFPASDIRYSMLDNIRQKQEEQNPSSHIGLPELIIPILETREIHERHKHILLVGPSQSGKTHITTSILNELNDAYILLPNENTFLKASEDNYTIPEAPSKAQFKIILLDNFHEFFKGGAISPKGLITKAIEKHITIWANCISIDEYDRVMEMLDFKDSHLGIFNEIRLDKKISQSEADLIANSLGVSKPLDSFNGLIGEIIYPPAAAIQNYNELKNDSIVTKDVLLFIKQAYMLGAFTVPYSMKLKIIKKAFSKKYSIDNMPLMKSLGLIQRKGFIKLSIDHTSFSFESVWFNKIIEPNMKAIDFVEFWDEILPLNVVTFTNLMVASKDYNSAFQIFEEMNIKKIIPDVRVFTALISKSRDYNTAYRWYDKIEPGKATIITYSSLINKSPDYDTALDWYDKIEPGKATTITYNSLIKKSPDYNTALKWYEKIEPGDATTITYNSLITKSPDYNTALKWYKKIEPGKATIYTYNILIKKSPNYNTAVHWFEKIDDGEADMYTYNTLIDKCTDIDIAIQWLRVVEEDSNLSAKIQNITYGALINVISRTNHYDKYQLAISFHDEMIEKGIKSNIKLYTNLIKIAPCFNQGLKLMELMISQESEENSKIIPNIKTRETMINKANGDPVLLRKLDCFFENNGLILN